MPGHLHTHMHMQLLMLSPLTVKILKHPSYAIDEGQIDLLFDSGEKEEGELSWLDEFAQQYKEEAGPPIGSNLSEESIKKQLARQNRPANVQSQHAYLAEFEGGNQESHHQTPPHWGGDYICGQQTHTTQGKGALLCPS